MPAKRKAKEPRQRRSSEDPAPTSSKPNKKRKREHATEEISNPADATGNVVEKDNTDHSILGGLSGGYRITGDEPGLDPTTTVFKVPFNDKQIICEHYERTDQDDNGSSAKDNTIQSSPSLVFTHGAGGGISNPATASFVEGFSHVDPVTCFQGTMNLQSRVKTFHAVLQHLHKQQAPKKTNKPLKTSLGGRSMGARAAVMTANATSTDTKSDVQIQALVLVSYPLVGGKNNDAVRDEILKQIPATTDVLFVVGSRDSMCDIARLREVRSNMAAKTWLVVVEGADHGMSLKNKTAVEPLRLETGAIAADWLRSRDRRKRYCHLWWNDEESEITGGDWVNEDEA